MRKIFLFIAAFCCAVMVQAVPKTAGAINGKFTINADGDQVYFAQGNLQYQASTNTWQFAEHQWETIGVANENIAADYDGYIDLFGYGTGDYPTDTSTNVANYRTFVDWGTNPILNGGNKADKWRTLSGDEWDYVIRRNNGAKYGLGSINGIYGAFILPDDFELPAGLTFTSGDGTTTTNSYSLEDWAKMEAKGAVFLPATGGTRLRTNVTVGEGTEYWSSQRYSTDYPYSLTILRDGFDNTMISEVSNCCSRVGASVRLVQNARIEIDSCKFTSSTGNIADFFTAGDLWNEGKSISVGSAMTAVWGAPYYWNTNNANLYKWDEQDSQWKCVEKGNGGTVLTGGRYFYEIQIRIDGSNADDYQFIEDVDAIGIKVDGVDWTNNGGFIATPPSGNYSYVVARSPEFELENIISNMALEVGFPDYGDSVSSAVSYLYEDYKLQISVDNASAYYFDHVVFYQGGGYAFGEDTFDEEVLLPNTTYKAHIWLHTEDGYMFDNLTTDQILINGEPALAVQKENDHELRCFVDFTTSKPLTEVNTVALTFTAPEQGTQMPENTIYATDPLFNVIGSALVPPGAGYEITEYTFYNAEGYLPTESTFLPNTTYEVTLLISPLEGYTFPMSGPFTDTGNMTITVNGEIAEMENLGSGLGILTIDHHFTTGKAEGFENVNDDAKSTKFMRDGVLYIERNGRIYNALGAELK